MYQPTRGIGGSIEEYELEKHLGKGGFADVFQAREVKTQARVAIKRLQKDVIRMGHNEKRVQNEINIHYKLKHPNILELFRYFEDDNFYYLVLEYCAGGELNKYIRLRSHLTDEEARKFFRQLIQAVIYLHSLNILHRDIKLTNILLTDKFDLKLADFGLSAQLQDEEDERFTMCGTPNFIAPEIVEHKNYSFKTDVWSLGVVLFFFLTGKLPFEVRDKSGQPRNAISHKTLSKVKQGYFEIPEFVSPEARDLLHRILDPYQRLSLAEVLSHTWLQSNPVNSENNGLQPKRPLNTTRLKPIQCKNGSILENGEVLVRDERQPTDYYIMPDGLELKVVDRASGLTTAVHQFHSIPSQYWRIYYYASRIVDAIRMRTPKVIYYSPQCKAILMETVDDLKCFFYNGVTTDYNLSSDKWKFSDIPSQFETVKTEYTSHASYCLSRCKQIEQLVSKLSSTSGEYFPVIFGTKPKRTASTPSTAGNSPLQLSTASIPSYRSTRSNLSNIDSMSNHSGNLSIPGSPIMAKDKQMFVPGAGWCYMKNTGEVVIFYSQGESITLSADCKKLLVYHFVNETSIYQVDEQMLRAVGASGRLVDVEQKLEFITKFKSIMYQFKPLLRE